MTYIECRQRGRTLFIGPFVKELDARAWFRRHEVRYQLHRVAFHDNRARVLYAAHEHDDLNRCIGVFEQSAAALAAAGKNGVVMNWRRSDCISPDESLPLQIPSDRRRAEPPPTTIRAGSH